MESSVSGKNKIKILDCAQTSYAISGKNGRLCANKLQPDVLTKLTIPFIKYKCNKCSRALQFFANLYKM
jgi:hypothetical protein